MLYVPPISNYKPFWIQFSTGNAIDIKSQYSVIVKTHDYPMAFKVKEPYKNQWKDEHGDEEYIPSDGLMVEAFTFKLECVMFAKPTSASQGVAAQTANEVLCKGIRDFRAALLAGEFKTADEWTGFGFQHVRLQEFPMPGNEAFDEMDGLARVIFTVVLKVNDPVTHMKKSGDNITEG